MIIESVFAHQQTIPSKYTCEGENISPPLRFLQVPSTAKSLVLIVDDPDAPKGIFDHWIMWNIPADVKEIKEGANEKYLAGLHVMQGSNGYKSLQYKGPCPPPGKPHRYFFKLYALDTVLELNQGASKSEVEKGMTGHIIDKTELIGTYQR